MSKQIFALIANHLVDLGDLFDQLANDAGDVVNGEEITDEDIAAVIEAPKSALELFTGKPAAAQSEPVYTMLVSDFTREQYHASGWTDDALVSNGKLTITYPNAPTPPAAPSAPTTNSAADTPTPAGTEVFRDKSGLPWDSRIHSGGRTMTKDELWVKKKGVSPQLVAQVTSELLAAKPAAAATPFAQVPAAPAPAAPPVAAATPAPAPAPQAPAAPGTASAAVAQALAAAADTGSPTTFKGIVDWLKSINLTAIQGLEAAQLVDPAIEGFGFLARPEYVNKIPEIVQLIKTMHGK